MTEVQVALLDDDLDGAAQVRVLQERARAAAVRDEDVPAGLRPARVDPLPVSVTVDEVRALGPRPPGKSGALVGAGGDTLGPRWLDVARDGPGLLVAGPMRSGRSTTLVTMTRSLLDQGWNAILLTPRRSPLRNMSLVPGVVAVLDADASGQAFTDAVAKAKRPLVVVVDDLELVPLDGPLPQAILDHLASIRDTGEAVIAAATTADVMVGIPRAAEGDPAFAVRGAADAAVLHGGRDVRAEAAALHGWRRRRPAVACWSSAGWPSRSRSHSPDPSGRQREC